MSTRRTEIHVLLAPSHTLHTQLEASLRKRRGFVVIHRLLIASSCSRRCWSISHSRTYSCGSRLHPSSILCSVGIIAWHWATTVECAATNDAMGARQMSGWSGLTDLAPPPLAPPPPWPPLRPPPRPPPAWPPP